MTSEAKAFAPANISCIFKIYYHKNPRWMGSYGIGFTINEGVISKVSESGTMQILFNNKKINFPTVKSVIKKLTNEKLKVEIITKLPLGCGFGLSGASALATAYAINKLCKLGKTNKELAIIAHTAEVENKTGLGDVVNQYYGGFCIKLKPSSYFIVRKVSISNVNIHCRYFSRLSTKSILANPKLKNRINKAASTALKKIIILLKSKKILKLDDVIRISKGFSAESGLLRDKKTLQTIFNIEKNRGNSSMIMLGNAVFSDQPFADSIKFKISNKAACII